MTVVAVDVPGTEARTYRVEIERGGLGRLGEACERHLPEASRLAVIADDRVADLYAERALGSLDERSLDAVLVRFPAGEASKSRAEWARLTDLLLDEGFGRDSGVVALGGGVTGDLAGFVAATFMRGVPVLQVPTSLLAMVDASVGGKTGVDTPRGKNLVGSFHHPVHVLADPELLATLPSDHLEAGLAEAAKAAAVRDADLFRWMGENAPGLVAADPDLLSDLVRRSVELKAAVVAEDPHESGYRQVLNFGHTVGHALESLSEWELLHGAAVAAGMRVEARLGVALGLTDPDAPRRLERLLTDLGHGDPIESRHSADEVLGRAASDKKAREGEVRFVLLDGIGRVARTGDGGWSHGLPAGRRREALEAALRPGTPRADSPPTDTT